MTETPNRPAEIAEFASRLTATDTVRIGLAKLWELWAIAAPRLVGAPTQVAGLAGALEDLNRQGVIELPRRAWDSATTPPLPRSIVVPAARHRSTTRKWITYPWCRELGWISSLPSLSDRVFDDLVAVNDWLARNRRTTPILPMRYRSAEIFGDEKRLDALAKTALVGPGRLTLDLLACARIPPPLPAVALGPGDDVLVVENSDTYWATVEILNSSNSDHRVGTVVWGSGNTFPAQVSALNVDVAGRGPVTGTIWYWGDLDPSGLATATRAAEAAADLGMPEIRPPHPLWAALAERPVQEAGTYDWSTALGKEWLGPELWELCRPIRVARGRVAQEAVAPTILRDWVASLDRQ